MNTAFQHDTNLSTVDSSDALSLLEQTDILRAKAYSQLSGAQRSDLGQFFTPPPIASFMASLFASLPKSISLLDAGAGVGALTAAFVAHVCQRKDKPEELSVSAYEIDTALRVYLEETMQACAQLCQSSGIEFTYTIHAEDFIEAGVAALEAGPLFTQDARQFDCVILNPPYRKINSSSRTRELLRTVGIETSNLYTAFLWLVVKLLKSDGELVAITPRSFCNGPYFRPFRTAFLDEMSFRQIHIFASRTKAFQDDEVLQENIIFRAVKALSQEPVIISSSASSDDEMSTYREVNHDLVVQPNDPDQFIHIVPDEVSHEIGQRMRGLTSTLTNIGISVSTGRVVDFRAKQYLQKSPGPDTVPLIYPGHIVGSGISWPNEGLKKPNALAMLPGVDDLLVPSGYYVLVKRFSSKEERRRVVAAVYDPNRIDTEYVGFENHLNYYHQGGMGISPALAYGLATFLNSTLVDQFFRQFNGHTQVNATDLRSLNYPTRSQLERIGERVGERHFDQYTLDNIVMEELNIMPEQSNTPDPFEAKKKVTEALDILRQLDLPRAQQNERSALTLLALLNLRAGTTWTSAGDPLRGITEMMDYFKEHFGVTYAPNTRETVRRQTVHQFIQSGLVLENPDQVRPPNSPKTRYQIEPSALKLLRTYGTDEWERNLEAYIATVEALKLLHAKEREMTLIPVRLPDGEEVKITGGGQNILIKSIVEEFCPRFTPGATVVYLGDAGLKLRGDELAYLKNLGIGLGERGKMPDVIVHYTVKNWLILIEAVTSHGPMDIKRHNELKQLFKGSSAPLVFVTAFATRRAMVRYLADIAWETEVWVADEPSHLIHFNGERFLGPYEVE